MDRRLKSSLIPSFAISRFLCFTPYDDSGNVLRNRVFLSAFINMTILVLMVTGFVVESANYERYQIKLKLLNYSRRLTHLTAIVSAVGYQTYWFAFEPLLMRSVFSRIERLSKVLRNTTNFTRLNWLTFATTVASTVAAMIVSFTYGRRRWYFSLTTFFIPNIFLILIITQITALLEVTRCLFQRLNNVTKESKDLYRCTQIHAVLCSVVRDVNRMYSGLLLFVITDLLVHVTTQVYDVFKAMGDSKSPGNESALIFLSARLTFIWSVCYFTTEVCWECKAFFKHMIGAMRARRYPYCDPTITLYAGVRPTVSITAAGLFAVSNHIFTSIIATGTTYFIVLIQFE